MPGEDELEQLLSRITEVGEPIKVRPYREVWRLPFKGRHVYLKWYPREGAAAKRVVRGGDSAAREYERLQWMQRAEVPAPRAIAYLGGLMLKGAKGDGVLTWALEPGETLDRVVPAGLASRERREVAGQVVSLLQNLIKANLGHSDLHLGNFLRHEGKLHLLDAYAVHRGGMDAHDLDVLGFAASGAATRTELLRGWRALGGGGGALPPLAGKVARRHWRKVVERATSESAYAGRAHVGEWRGTYFKTWKFPRPSCPASSLTVTADDWRREWPRLWERVRSDTLQALKRGPSGDIWAGDVVLAGVPVEIVVKRPFRRHAYRYVTELGRGSRAWRAWRKGWMLTARGINTAWPLAVFERKVAGVVVDQAIICEKVQARQLDQFDIDALAPGVRELLFRRVGKVLRRIDDTRIVHFDTKASNFMVRVDPSRGPEVVLVDVDGVRSYPWRGEGIRRLEASLRRHQKRIRDEDIAALWLGYAPYGKRGEP